MVGLWLMKKRYRAPECLLTDGYYNYKMDMWGVGCVFFEIVSLFPLFPGIIILSLPIVIPTFMVTSTMGKPILGW